MAGVIDSNCWYKATGDQYCGRILSGSFCFAVFAPQFRLNESENKGLKRLILTLFPNMPDGLRSIVKYGIASITLQDDWIKEKVSNEN